ncbi:MAG: hypothetical protein ACREC1_00580 [Methylovirgula sp.]
MDFSDDACLIAKPNPIILNKIASAGCRRIIAVVALAAGPEFALKSGFWCVYQRNSWRYRAHLGTNFRTIRLPKSLRVRAIDGGPNAPQFLDLLNSAERLPEMP